MNWHQTRIGVITLAIALATNIANADTAIPIQFHGVWGTVKSCKAWISKPSARLGAPEAGAEIAARIIEFGESTCTVKLISMSEGEHLQISLSCAGEGETWSRKIKMALNKNEALKIDDGPYLKKCR